MDAVFDIRDDAFAAVLGARRGHDDDAYAAARIDPELDEYTKLKRAFALLRKRGVAARICRTDYEAEDYVPPDGADGYVWTKATAPYHEERARVARGRPSPNSHEHLRLYLNHGVRKLARDSKDIDERRHLAHTHTVVKTLREAGLNVVWDGTLSSAIVVIPWPVR